MDDCTFGGGKGMLLMAEPIAQAFEAVAEHTGVRPHILYMSPVDAFWTKRRSKRSPGTKTC